MVENTCWNKGVDSMELETYLQFLLFILCGLDGLVILIFILRQNDQGYDYDRIIRELNEQKEQNLNLIDSGNKEIEKIEKQILECKKVLGIRLFKNNLFFMNMYT